MSLAQALDPPDSKKYRSGRNAQYIMLNASFLVRLFTFLDWKCCLILESPPPPAVHILCTKPLLSTLRCTEEPTKITLVTHSLPVACQHQHHNHLNHRLLKYQNNSNKPERLLHGSHILYLSDAADADLLPLHRVRLHRHVCQGNSELKARQDTETEIWIPKITQPGCVEMRRWDENWDAGFF